jgi:hypothetical protein
MARIAIMEAIPERRLLDLIEWLAGNECHDLDDAGLIAGLGRRLSALPLPIDRFTLHLRTLHPEILARVIAWSPEAPIEIYDREHGMERLAAFATSPIRDVMETREWRTIRADQGGEVLGQIDYFRGRGIAELVIAPLLNGGGPVSAVPFGTRGTRGFAPAERQALERILPALRGVCELRLLRQAEATLLDTYVGVATANGSSPAMSGAATSKACRRRCCFAICATSPVSPTACSRFRCWTDSTSISTRSCRRSPPEAARSSNSWATPSSPSSIATTARRRAAPRRTRPPATRWPR